MSTADKLNKILESKEAIRQSIIAKGTDVGTDVPFSDYASKIDEIQTGSGESYINPDFYELRTMGGTSYKYLFYYNEATSLDLSGWDTSKVTNMVSMFHLCPNLTSLDVSKWDTSNVTDMNNMFYCCKKLTEVDVSKWDTSKVTDMNNMFYNCNDLTSLDVSKWDTSKVTNMYGMFNCCNNLTSLDLSGWDTSKVTIMLSSAYPMIGDNKKLKTIKGNIDCSSLSKGLYLSYAHMFKNCPVLEEVYLTNIYKNSVLTNKADFSINLKTTVIKDECLISIINELPDLINDKGLTSTDKIVLTLPPTNTLSPSQVQVALDKGWQVANINENITDEGLQPYAIGEFKSNKEITEVETIVTSDHTDLSEMLYGCSALTSVNEEEWATNNVTNMYCMFTNCSALTSLDLAKFITNNVTNMKYMFYGATSITSFGDISNWNVSNVTNMNGTFNKCQSVVALDLSGWDTSNVQSMYGMFANCSSLEELDIRNFSTESIPHDSSDKDNNMEQMFLNCTSLRELRLDNCSNTTILDITTTSKFPTFTDGSIHNIYVQETNIDGVKAPEGWTFVYVD